MCLLRGTDWIFIGGRFIIQVVKMSSSVYKFAYWIEFLELKPNDPTLLFCPINNNKNNSSSFRRMLVLLVTCLNGMTFTVWWSGRPTYWCPIAPSVAWHGFMSAVMTKWPALYRQEVFTYSRHGFVCVGILIENAIPTPTQVSNRNHICYSMFHNTWHRWIEAI